MGGFGVRPNTGILFTAFGLNQPYESAIKLRADILLEMVESKLDESLGMLETDAARRAREEVRIVNQFGTWSDFMKEAENKVKETSSEGAILPAAPPTSS